MDDVPETAIESRPELLLQPVNGNTAALSSNAPKDKRRNMVFSWRIRPAGLVRGLPTTIELSTTGAYRGFSARAW
jgi:hypothetical protein